MTLGDGIAVGIHQRAEALGFGKRRSTLFWSWWYGATLAIAGSAEAILSVVLGQAPDRGFIMAALGIVLSAMGWTLTARTRFSSKPPKPATDADRLEKGIPLYPRVVAASIVLTAAMIVVLVLFRPGGASPEGIPVLGLVAAAGLSISGGMARSGWLMKNSSGLYARWLERRDSSGLPSAL